MRCPDGPPELRENYGFAQKDVGKIGDALVANMATLCTAWRQIHGDD